LKIRAAPLHRCIAAAALVVAACAAQPPQTISDRAAQPANFQRDYEDAARRGAPVFVVDAERSQVLIEVRRAGTLARLGHDHVVVAHRVRGFVVPQEGRADLYVRLDELAVDEEDARRAAGLDTHPTPEQIEGTRHNMLTREIDAAQHPFVVVRVTDARPPAPKVAIELNGTTRVVPVAMQADTTADAVRVSGSFAIDQTAFGITPLSLAGGAVQVADRVDIRFAIVARRIAP